jgi:hypothetical protein
MPILVYESPAAPDLHLMIPELPAHHGVVLWRARFTNSHSSLKLVLLCHTRDITPLLDISSARYPSFHILRNKQTAKQSKSNLIYIGAHRLAL